MNQSFIEIRSALWQKVFVSIIALICIGVGIACWISPFYPLFQVGSSNALKALFTGLFLILSAAWSWWRVMTYSIRADDEGIRQICGFFRNSVRWSDVASYCLESQKNVLTGKRFDLKPMMFDRTGNKKFDTFSPVFICSSKIIAQRFELWQFVEKKLQGKKVEYNPIFLKTSSLVDVRDVERLENDLWFKLCSVIGIVCRTWFWIGFTIAPVICILISNVKVIEFWAISMVFNAILLLSSAVLSGYIFYHRDLPPVK